MNEGTYHCMSTCVMGTQLPASYGSVMLFNFLVSYLPPSPLLHGHTHWVILQTASAMSHTEYESCLTCSKTMQSDGYNSDCQTADVNLTCTITLTAVCAQERSLSARCQSWVCI